MCCATPTRNEGTHEPEWCREHEGVRTFEHSESVGVAGDRMLASQCVQLSDRKRRVIAEYGVHTAHMPLFTGAVGGGIAPVSESLADVVRVGVGSDGDIHDPFEVMPGAFLIHKARLQDPQVMSASTVFDRATAGVHVWWGWTGSAGRSRAGRPICSWSAPTRRRRSPGTMCGTRSCCGGLDGM